MLHDTRSHSLAGFLAGDFSRVSSAVALEICRTAKLSPDARPRNIHGEDAEALYKAIQTTKIMAPPSNSISPIGEKAILHGLYKQIKGNFYTAVTRPPAVYRGNPFVIEAGLAYGKGLDPAAAAPDAPARPARRGRAGGGRRRAGARHPLRQPRPAPLPAVGLRDLQGRARHRLADVRRDPVPGRAPGRPHGGLRPHGLGLGPLHQRVQGGDRRLRRDPEGDQARAPGVRTPARRVPAAARAGGERVPPAEHLRALHRGGRRRLRPPEGRPAAQGEAQGPAAEDRHEADRRVPGPTRSWAARAARRGCRTRSSSPPEGPEGEAPVLPDAEEAAAVAPDEVAAGPERPPARRKGQASAVRPARRKGQASAVRPARPARAVAREVATAARRAASKSTNHRKR